ncbi:MAG: pyridoxamine 5'-phosphate oxidase family protein [Thermoguttaceae bacterium]
MNIKQLTPNETRKAAEKFLQGRCPLVMATTGDDGFPDVRCLAVGATDGVDAIWFATETHSTKSAQLKKNPKAALYAYNSQEFGECRLYGTVEFLSDRASREKVWKDSYAMYWPDGIDSPNMVVLKFKIERCRYGTMDGDAIVVGTF